MISRQLALQELNSLIDRFEQILRNIRKANGNDSVCGMCEYNGSYIGQSGNWCNECPGFNEEDCFKLSDKCRKRWLKSVNLPSAQPECEAWHKTIEEGFPAEGEKVLVTDGTYFWLDESVANDVGLQWESGQSLWEKTEWAYFKDLYKNDKSNEKMFGMSIKALSQTSQDKGKHNDK